MQPARPETERLFFVENCVTAIVHVSFAHVLTVRASSWARVKAARPEPVFGFELVFRRV